MKRLISILVIVALLVSICPAALADDDIEALKKRIAELEVEIAGKDAIIQSLTDSLISGKTAKTLSDEEREQIFYEVAKEKGLDLTDSIVASWEQAIEALTRQPEPKSTLAPIYDIGPSPKENDYVSIEDVKLVLVENGKVRPNIKVRCLYPEGELEKYPNRLWITCNYLNSNDEIIQSFTAAFKHPAYNQVLWSKSNNFSHMNGNDIFVLNEVSKIQFVWYKFQTIDGGRSTWQRELDFLSPISFDVANLELDK